MHESFNLPTKGFQPFMIPKFGRAVEKGWFRKQARGDLMPPRTEVKSTVLSKSHPTY